MDVADESWFPLIVRNVFIGGTQFDQLQQSLGISRCRRSDLDAKPDHPS